MFNTDDRRRLGALDQETSNTGNPNSDFEGRMDYGLISVSCRLSAREQRRSSWISPPARRRWRTWPSAIDAYGARSRAAGQGCMRTPARTCSWGRSLDPACSRSPVCPARRRRCSQRPGEAWRWNQPSPNLHAMRRIRLEINKLIISGTTTWVSIYCTWTAWMNRVTKISDRSKSSWPAAAYWSEQSRRRHTGCGRSMPANDNWISFYIHYINGSA
jgi:hypothetical protein